MVYNIDVQNRTLFNGDHMNFFDNKMYCKELYELIVKPICEKHKITHMEYTILMYLHSHPNDNTASKIIKKLFLTKSHVSITLKTLQEKELIVGEHKGKNLRIIYLRLCDKAKIIIEDGKNIRDMFNSVLLNGLSKDEVEQLGILLKTINNNVLEYLEKNR